MVLRRCLARMRLTLLPRSHVDIFACDWSWHSVGVGGVSVLLRKVQHRVASLAIHESLVDLQLSISIGFCSYL